MSMLRHRVYKAPKADMPVVDWELEQFTGDGIVLRCRKEGGAWVTAVDTTKAGGVIKFRVGPLERNGLPVRIET